MKRLYNAILLNTYLIVTCWSQNTSSIDQRLFLGEITYDFYSTVDVSTNNPKAFFLKSLESVSEQVFSFTDEDIMITDKANRDTSTVAICNPFDTYTIFYPEKTKMRFGASNENNIDNYTKTSERKLVMGFICHKYEYQVNDDIYVEKWITPDFEYSYPSHYKGQCHRIFTKYGLLVARKSTIKSPDQYTILHENRLSSFVYDSLYVRSNQIGNTDENNQEIVDYNESKSNLNYKLLAHKDRSNIQLDSIIDVEYNYIDGDIYLANYTLINFWASWSRPSLNSMPYLSKLKDSYSSEGFNILSLSIDQDISHDEWLEYIDEYKMDWDNGRIKIDKKSKSWNSLPIPFLPRYLLVDKNGIIIMDQIEGIRSKEFETFLQNLLLSDN